MVGNWTPQAQATMTGDNFITEITGDFTDATVVDVDSEGRIFVGSKGDIWRSEDNGDTWTKVLDGTEVADGPYLLFVDDKDYIHADLWKSVEAQDSIYRSIDNGDSWSETLTNVIWNWGVDQAPNGTIYIATYGTPPAPHCLRSSNDNGATWNVVYNLTGQIKHIHTVKANPSNNDVWIATGDGLSNTTIQRFRNDTQTWETLINSTYYCSTDILFDDECAYCLPDGQEYVRRVPYRADADEFETVWCTRYGPKSSTNFAFRGIGFEYTDDMLLFGTEDGQLWGSWDGEHWVKIADFGDAQSIFSFSRRRPIYFTERTQGKLYRLDVTKEVLVRLYYQVLFVNNQRGYKNNAVSFTLEQRIGNGSDNRLELTDVGLSSVQATIIGLSHNNYFNNSGFETGDTTGWTISGAGTGTHTVVSDVKYEGTYSFKVEKISADGWDKELKQLDISTQNNTISICTFYIKGNITIESISTPPFSVVWYEGATPKQADNFDLTTSWNRITSTYMTSASSVHPSLLFRKGYNVTYWVDGLTCEQPEQDGFTWYGLGADSVQSMSSVQYMIGMQNTTNPTLTINSQTVSHTGTLTNGTESSATSLSGILTGAVQVSANIQGSGQAILKINGTRLLYEDSIILKGRTNSIYHGRYYGTFSPTTTTTDLIAVTNLASNITSVSYANNKLTLTITSPSSTTSTSKVYCGNKGKPERVTGATYWSYNSATHICTVTIIHSSSKQVVLDWSETPTARLYGMILAILPFAPLVILPFVFGLLILAVKTGAGAEIENLVFYIFALAIGIVIMAIIIGTLSVVLNVY